MRRNEAKGEKETEKILDADSVPPPPLTHPDLTNRSLLKVYYTVCEHRSYSDVQSILMYVESQHRCAQSVSMC